MTTEAFIRRSPDAEARRTMPPGITIIDVMEVSGTITASDGVPLVSDRADEVLNTLDDGTQRDFEYKSYDPPTHPVNETPSRFPDGKPHPLPISGLEERRFHEQYRSMIRVMSTVREVYIRQSSDTNVNRQLTASEMHEVLAGLMFLPQYLVLRSQRPHRAQNAFHPSVTILSNAASGSLGAIQAWVNLQEKNHISREEALKMIPDENLMIAQVEEEKGMVGKKTLCPVRPPRQRRFLSSVRDGVEVADPHNDTFDITIVVSMDELPQIIKFGEAAYTAKGVHDIFANLDKQKAPEIRRDIQKKRFRQVKQTVARFLETTKEHNTKLTTLQVQMNRALGRNIQVGVTLDSFERMGFEMPKIIRDLKAEDRGRGVCYPRLPKQTEPIVIAIAS